LIPEYFYKSILEKLPDVDPPLAYGQYINAEITSQILDSQELLDSILSLTPQKGGGGDGGSSSAGDVKLI